MWIVTGNEKEMIKLISSKDVDAIIPNGSYITVISDDEVKHILHVEESYQRSLFEPSPLIIDSKLPILFQDQECKNIILAREIRQFPLRDDGMFSYIKPNQIGRRTTQEEVNEIFKNHCK